MCGNFGLLIVKATGTDGKQHNNDPFSGNNSHDPHSELNRSLRHSIHEVGKVGGVRVADDVRGGAGTGAAVSGTSTGANGTAIDSFEDDHVGKLHMGIGTHSLMTPVAILRNQTACTEARGGQAGGISYIDFHPNNSSTTNSSVFGEQFSSLHNMEPLVTRTRMVANKRTPLAEELAELFIQEQAIDNKEPTGLAAGLDILPQKPYSHESSLAISALGHTRFATSSINVTSELHPHEWEEFHREHVWRFNPLLGRMEKALSVVGVHITHNGDFDELSAYNNKMVNEEVGWWLERLLHVPNDNIGDSPKIAGFMDLFRVQG